MSSLAENWQAFKNDEPGTRFRRQRERMKSNGRGLTIALVVLGSLLLAGGVVLLFIPGPGLLLIVFGLALIAGVSRRLARWMDRAESRISTVIRKLRSRWRREKTRA